MQRHVWYHTMPRDETYPPIPRLPRYAAWFARYVAKRCRKAQTNGDHSTLPYVAPATYVAGSQGRYRWIGLAKTQASIANETASLPYIGSYRAKTLGSAGLSSIAANSRKSMAIRKLIGRQSGRYSGAGLASVPAVRYAS